MTIGRAPFGELPKELLWVMSVALVFGFLAMPAGAGGAAAISLVAAGLAGLKVALRAAYARWWAPIWHLDLTDAGHFALHRGRPREARWIGRTGDLELDASAAPSPATLHRIVLEHGPEAMEIDRLTDRDVHAIRAVLSPRIATF